MLVAGEILWDIFRDGRRLGGAPLNLAVHSARLGASPRVLSAVGADELGREALSLIGRLGLDTSFISTVSDYPTGTAGVRGEETGHPVFRLERPAAYDGVKLEAGQLEALAAWQPEWLCFGTLFPFGPAGAVLEALFTALPGARRLYDVNLRPGNYSPEMVRSLLARANVVKLNETEMEEISALCGIRESGTAAFCEAGMRRFHWDAVCVTLGERGCALRVGDDYAESEGIPVTVADPVGAGDAFAAAFRHGLTEGWPAARIAATANRLGALVASRPGAIPDWSVEEVM